MNFSRYIVLALKGCAMGMADVVPGVSGGTIAFISGIYEELLDSIRSVNATALKLLLKLRLGEFWRHINGSFLLPVLLGFFCDVPITAKLKKLYGGRVAAGAIYMKTGYRTVLWAIITAAATIAAVHWGRDYSLFGWLGGILLTLATTIGRLGVNQRNAANYFVKYEKFMDKAISSALLKQVEHGDLSFKMEE